MRKSKKLLFFIGIALLFFSVNACKQVPPVMQDKPNVIIILADDLGYNDVGFQGCKDIPTPNINRIAENGTVFTNGYVSYAVCGPSRAGLITGRYQDRFGFGRNPLFAPNDTLQGLPLTEETLASVLDKAGYQTMAIGKWHLGAHETQRPLNRGFNEFFGFLSGGHNYFPENFTLNNISEVKRQYDPYKVKLLKNNTRVDENEYLTDALSREAVNFIERNTENPFFLYLAYNAPHAPLQATDNYLARFDTISNKKRKTYAAMVSAMDDGIGKVLNKLDSLNLTNNTIVFFLSDNGGPERHNASNNDPLREGKGSLYEGGIRVPFAVQWPDKIRKQNIYENPVISLDIFATVVKYANASHKNEIDGVDLLPFIGNDFPVTSAVPHEELFWRKFDAGEYAVRFGDLKYCNIDNSKELYNIVEDISESTPTDTVNSSEYKNIQTSLQSWKNEIMEPIFLGLMHDKKYTEKHPERFNIEKY